MAFGTDMLLQPGKLGIQSVLMTRFEKVFGAVGTLKIVTSGNAELLGLSGKRSPYGEAPLGVIREGAWADPLVMDGNPLENLSMLADPGTSLALIMKNGTVHKNHPGWVNGRRECPSPFRALTPSRQPPAVTRKFVPVRGASPALEKLALKITLAGA